MEGKLGLFFCMEGRELVLDKNKGSKLTERSGKGVKSLR